MSDTETDESMSALSNETLALAEIAWEAGEIVLRHYASDDLNLKQKSDRSPVTVADEEAEAHILGRLKHRYPGVSVIAEEAVSAGHIPKIGSRFFLVDPLDGTKEFLGRNGEFTVNIGEIEDGVPIRGVVGIPARNQLFLGARSEGAFEMAIEPNVRPDFGRLQPIGARAPAPDGLVAVASRSHRDDKTEEYLAQFTVKDFAAAGSSLKFCLIAAGNADIYPRLGRTMEWDTAAGHAVLLAAGGSVTTLDGQPLKYGKAEDGFANPFFVARGRC